jgi:L-gulono-1,4-lactone dehydrogenase
VSEQVSDMFARGSLGPGRRWQNWGRSERGHPQFLARPGSVDELIEVVQFARDRGLTVKPVGASHSFTSIAATTGVQVDLSRLDGLYGVEGTRATLGAGTNFYQLPALLDPWGLALANMGDIDRQTIAGAISTGTHGTGSRFGGLATQIVALTLVTASGELLRVSETENTELLPAAAVGLGALGIVVEATIECVPSFRLRAVERPEPLADVLDNFALRAAAVDHFEFYWFPHTETALTKTNTRLPMDAPRKPQAPVAAWVDDELLANGFYALTCGLGRAVPAIIPGVNRLAERLVAERDVTDASYRVFVSNRGVRFREMEYAIPSEHIPAAVRAVKQLIEAKGWRISFPIEVRVAAADNLWLSTASGRETGYVAVHRYYREDPTEYFEAVEQIMIGFGGRPHWGKMHYQNEASLSNLYPHFADFLALRDRLDPGRVFGNAYLERVLGS